MRLEFELLKEERRLLDNERVSKTKDIDALVQLSSVYSREIDDMKNDIRTLTDSNEWLKSSLLSAKQQSESMDLARKNVLREIEEEKHRVADLEREISDLKMEIEKLRRQREDLRASVSLNEERCRSADQDRHLMISGLEQQRQKLQEWRQSRMEAVSEKEKLVETITALKGKWNSNDPHTHAIPQTTPSMIRRDTYRDKKGVPNSIAYSSSILRESPPLRGVDAGTASRFREQWETFAGQPSRNIVGRPPANQKVSRPNLHEDPEPVSREKEIRSMERGRHRDTFSGRQSPVESSPSDEDQRTSKNKRSKRRSRSRPRKQEETAAANKGSARDSKRTEAEADSEFQFGSAFD
eukprot:Gregarina_sp_Poly_1__5644@NODE_2979_length_1485_cov_105_384344_g354_i3_p1_GENE_NODE_2979_length_1485_cov_105_384344_g354_i3NODE_2979_length_1485_cov_105_384344_g354_i3_p1_ORF_typecomplete_len353_score69_73DUF2353/PF09789_9/4_9e05DUF2353/PF09789_9/3_6e03DUF4200/PF13863_6/0_0011DUF4200/PF13863_6/3_3e02FlaC_arch/PF05377_11/2_7e02FlaC_arch/PF05377_11/0_0012Spc7/PF08317_11/0_0048DUF4618/PF15397_6/0_0028DUF4618/PF15397_6/3_8e02CENPF_leu_zip/PF10473_9/0_29CENPF_leu_zip/PF10473_9/0_12AAA_13/PF13166_6/0_